MAIILLLSLDLYVLRSQVDMENVLFFKKNLTQNLKKKLSNKTDGLFLLTIKNDL